MLFICLFVSLFVFIDATRRTSKHLSGYTKERTQKFHQEMERATGRNFVNTIQKDMFPVTRPIHSFQTLNIPWHHTFVNCFVFCIYCSLNCPLTDPKFSSLGWVTRIKTINFGWPKEKILTKTICLYSFSISYNF